MLEITFLVSLTQQQSLKFPDNLDFAKAVDFMKIFQAKLPSNVLTEKDFENYIIAKNYVLEKRRELMIQRKNVVGYKPKFFILNQYESIDIDYWFDFQIAEFLYTIN